MLALLGVDAGISTASAVGAATARTSNRAPKTPPRTWAMAYSSPLPQEVCPVRQVAKVTAGLRCPPDTLAVQYTAGQAGRRPGCQHVLAERAPVVLGEVLAL